MDQKLNKLTLDPIIQKFVDELSQKGGKPLYQLSYEDARKVLDDIQSEPVALVPADSQDLIISERSKESINIRIIRPTNSKNDNKNILPVIVFMHGGGWILGNPNTHDRLVREIANGSQAAVIVVDYTPAPEGQYPKAHEQGYTAAEWVKNHGKEYNLDSSRMIIAGDSVGGLMATAIALMAHERKGPRFLFQLLFYPVTDAHFDTPSYNLYANGPWLTKRAMEWFWDAYVPNKQDRKHSFASPLQASTDQLKHLPPALIFTNEYDVLRDEGEAYAHKLMQASVPVSAFRTLGMIHDSALLNPITQAAGVRSMITLANQTLINIFTKK